jgi:hypothetical protein
MKRTLLLLIVGAMMASTSLTSHAGTGARRDDKRAGGASAATAVLLASGLQGASGSAIGPGGALFVTEGALGRILRIDPRSGEATIFATGLPPAVIPGLGGAIDVAFVGSTAYALVTLVGPDVLGSSLVGIYRIDGPDSYTVIADIGAFAIANPPPEFDVPTGLQYAIEPYRGGFLVSDGHHNRVLHVSHDGEVTVMMAFDNIVPTGLAVSGKTIYMAEAGPIPHAPGDGKVVAFNARSSAVTEVASGAPLLVDVEFGRGRTLFALSQGVFPGGLPASPASPNTGALVRVNRDGTFTVIVDELNLPTSVEFIGNTAYVVTLGGEIWKIDDVAGAPFGAP